jgi:hypothetical protein
MSGDRHLRRTRRFDSSQLAELTKKPVEEQLQQPGTSDDGEEAALAIASRTATVHDPLTTELLAEVARRSQTIEVSPDMVDTAIEEAEPDAPKRSRK